MRGCPAHTFPQADPRAAFAAWTAKYGKGYANDLVVRPACAARAARRGRCTTAASCMGRRGGGRVAWARPSRGSSRKRCAYPAFAQRAMWAVQARPPRPPDAPCRPDSVPRVRQASERRFAIWKDNLDFAVAYNAHTTSHWVRMGGAGPGSTRAAGRPRGRACGGTQGCQGRRGGPAARVARDTCDIAREPAQRRPA